MGWVERQWKRFLIGSPATVVDSSPEFGIAILFEVLASSSPSFSWIRLNEVDDAISIGSKISRALELSHGTVLFGTGMPYSYALNYLAGLSRDLGPQCLMVEDAHLHDAFVEAALLVSRRSQGRLRVVLAGHGDSAAWRERVQAFAGNLVSETDLELSEAEWISVIVSAGLDASFASSTCREEKRTYRRLVSTIRSVSGAPEANLQIDGTNLAFRDSPLAPSGVGSGITELDRFARTVQTNPEQALADLSNVGDSFFGQGRVLELRILVERLLEVSPSDANCLYWWYQAHIALGEQARVEERVARMVRSSPRRAPALTACFASSARPSDAISLASAALEERSVPETLASIGFLRLLEGQFEDGVRELKAAHAGYIDAGSWHRAVQVGNSIGSAFVSLGDFDSAVLWGRRGLEELRRREIREELVRLSTTNLLAYAQLLVGEIERGLETLSSVQAPTSGALPPTLEGLLTTFGDYAIATGEHDRAVEYYQRVFDVHSERLPGYASHHLVRGLVHAGMFARATSVARHSAERVHLADENEAALVAVSEMLMEACVGCPTTQDVYGLLAKPAVASDAVTRSEVALYAANCWQRRGHLDDARSILNDELPTLRRLGRSGWRLLSPPNADIDALQNLLGLSESAPARLGVLGRGYLERSGHRERLGKRYLELLAVLAFKPEGLSGEALLVELYGDAGRVNTLKSMVSRARKHVSIESSPYRLGECLLVDANELDEYLAQGDLHRALELYRGPLLPESEAPGIVRERERIDEALRQAILLSGEQDLTLRLARKFGDDLELWERAQELTATDDPAYPLVRAQVRRIRGEWGL